jgi:AcrR family transcriptional regulator
MAASQTLSASRTGYHHGDLRAAIIGATEQLIAERGPDSVSVREAARRAGVSSGAPFHHFPTRQALMTAVAETATRQLRQRIETAVADIPPTKPAKRVRTAIHAWLSWVVDNPDRFKVLSAERRMDPIEPILAIMREGLRQTIRSGGKRAIDLDLAMLEMRAMACGLARMHVDGQPGVTVVAGLARMTAALDDLLARLKRGKGT